MRESNNFYFPSSMKSPLQKEKPRMNFYSLG